MLTSVKGTYRNGHVELQEPPADVQDETPVIVTFLEQEGINSSAQGPASSQRQPRVAGLHRGAAWVSEDFDQPLPDEFWMGN